MNQPEEDFASMFEASLKAKRFEKGQTIEGTIVGIGSEVAFVNVGGKGEASIDISELKDPDPLPLDVDALDLECAGHPDRDLAGPVPRQLPLGDGGAVSQGLVLRAGGGTPM